MKFIPLEERILLDAALVATVIYVDHEASSGGNGSSWAQAYNNLQSALAQAQVNHDAGASNQQIWMADGNYSPSAGGTNLREHSFQLVDGLSLYGGFQGLSKAGGGETALAQRGNSYTTVLNGNLGNLNSTADNSLHIIKAQSVSALLDSVTISGGNANGTDLLSNSYGAGIYSIDSSLTLLNIHMTKNHAERFGGGIYAEGGSLTIDGSKFTYNDASRGGEASMTQETADADGGAITAFNATVSVDNSQFLHNTAGDDGAGIHTRGSSLSVNHSVFADNFGKGALVSLDLAAPLETQLIGGSGGAIDFEPGSTFEVRNSHFEYNKSGFGGAIDAFGASVGTIIEHNTFYKNSASYIGGAIFSVLTNNGVFSHNDFNDNFAKETGGAIYAAESGLDISWSTFTNNKADVSGGAIGVDSFVSILAGIPAPLITITDSAFTNNISYGKPSEFIQLPGIQNMEYIAKGGGAINVSLSSHLDIYRTSFIQNKAYNGDGGAIHLATNAFAGFTPPESHVNVYDSVFLGNQAVNGGAIANGGDLVGGGVLPGTASQDAQHFSATNVLFLNNSSTQKGGAIVNWNAGQVTIDASIFMNNRSNTYGGAIASDGVEGNLASLHITNSLFTLNRAASGGAIWVDDTNVEIEDSVFLLNKARQIVADADSLLALQNVLVL